MAEGSRKLNMSELVAVAIVLTAVFGNFAIADISIMGITPTYYRVIIPVLFFICAFLNWKNGSRIILVKDRNVIVNKAFFLMGLIWVLYGAVSVMISPWSSLGSGAKELLGIVWGFLSVYVIITLCMKGQIGNVIVAMKTVLAVALLIGYIEVFSGWHMGVSRLSDPAYIALLYELYPDAEIDVFMHNVATAFFYNQNDYCAFLTIMSPLCLYYKSDSCLINRVLHYAGLALVFMMLLIDDSFICTIAFIMGAIFYLVFAKASWRQWLVTSAVIAAVRLLGNNVVNAVFYIIPGGAEIQMAKLNASLGAQLANMEAGSGSLLYRINTYTISIAETFTQSKGFGLGAGSFVNYFAEDAERRKMMSNPHSLWLEIFSQYGIIIFLLVIAVFILVFIEMFRLLKKTDHHIPTMITSMGICLIVACFAPSNFLGGSYYWIVFGLALGVISENKTREREFFK